MKTPKEQKHEIFRINGKPFMEFLPEDKLIQMVNETPFTFKCLNKSEIHELLNWLIKISEEL